MSQVLTSVSEELSENILINFPPRTYIIIESKNSQYDPDLLYRSYQSGKIYCNYFMTLPRTTIEHFQISLHGLYLAFRQRTPYIVNPTVKEAYNFLNTRIPDRGKLNTMMEKIRGYHKLLKAHE